MQRTRVLALHLTKPSTSEAKVLGTLLRSAAPDLEFMLATNLRGVEDEASYFHDMHLHNRNVTECALDVGMPADPTLPTHLVLRALWRVDRRLKRRAMLDLAREYAPQIVYTSQQTYDCQVGEWIARELDVPHAVHLHYKIGPWLGWGTLDRIRSCDLLLCVSQFIAEQARKSGVPEQRLLMLHNALDVPEVRAPERAANAPITIGQTGRMALGKGFGETLAAFIALRRRVPSARLLLVGDGPERPSLEAAARSAGVAEHVRFTGWLPNVSAALNEIDIFAFPSRDEPFGLALLEACAAGIPCVAYRDGAVPEIVEHERTGLLIAPLDVPALTDAFARLCEHPSERRAFGAAAREHVRTAFNPSLAAERFSASLRQLVHRRACAS